MTPYDRVKSYTRASTSFSWAFLIWFDPIASIRTIGVYLHHFNTLCLRIYLGFFYYISFGKIPIDYVFIINYFIINTLHYMETTNRKIVCPNLQSSGFILFTEIFLNWCLFLTQWIFFFYGNINEYIRYLLQYFICP